MSKTCVLDFKEAIKDLMDKNEAQALMNEVEQRAQVRTRDKLENMATARKKTVEDILKEMDQEHAYQKRVAYLKIKAYKANKDVINSFKNRGRGLEAILDGVETNRKNGRFSAGLRMKSTSQRLLSRLAMGLKKDSVLEDFNLKTNELNIAKELFEEGASGDNRAALVARNIKTVMRQGIKLLNDAGANIKEREDYIVRQSHDPLKMMQTADSLADRLRIRKELSFDREALFNTAFTRWKNTILPLLDQDKTFQGADADKFLRNAFEAIVTGIRKDSPELLENQPSFSSFTRPKGKAGKLSAERILHFKDGESFYRYNQKYGFSTVHDAVTHGIQRMGENIGLMRALGPDPDGMFEQLKRDVLKENRLQKGVKGKVKQAGWTYDILSGKTQAGSQGLMGRILMGYKMVQYMSKLGSILPASLPDAAFNGAATREVGGKYLEAYQRVVSGFIQGKPKGELGRIGDELSVWADGTIGHTLTRFGTVDSPRGFLSKMMETFWKFSGMSRFDETSRVGFATMLSRDLANQRELKLSNLNGDLPKIFSLYGIEAKEWNLIRSNLKNIGTAAGKYYITPEIANYLDKESIANYLGKNVTELKANEINKVREDIQERLGAFFTDQTDYANIQPRASSRAMIIGNTHADSPIGAALRLFSMFKMFNIEMTRRTVGRFLYGNGAENLYDAVFKGQGDLKGLATYIVNSLPWGYISLAARSLSQGLTPPDPMSKQTWFRAWLAGSGLFIFGDFLTGQFDRYGHTLTDDLLGPGFSTLNDMANVLATLRDGENPTKIAFQLAKGNMPFVNLFYTRAALDYMILYGLQEKLSPGYLDRLQQNVQRNSGENFFFSPSQYAVRY